MPLFHYKASTGEGEVVEGEYEAPDAQAVVRYLQSSGQIPIRVREAHGMAALHLPGIGRNRRVRAQDLHAFTEELATLLRAGLPLERSLQMLVELSGDSPLGGLVARVLDRVRSGSSLSDALEAQGSVFSRLYVNMVRAGELGGSLDGVLTRLADYLRRSRELRETIVSALVYPAILVVVSVISVLVLLTFVVPHFTQLFEDADQALPLMTQVVVASGDFMAGYGWTIPIGAVLLYLFLRRQLRRPQSRLRWDRRLLRLPLFGDLIRKLETARLSRTLGTLLGNGVPLLAGLSIVRETLGNRVLAEGLGTAVDGLKEGKGMADPLLQADVFPKLGVQMIKVGEQTGRLEDMLIQVADVYDREVRTAIQRMLTLLEPVLIVGLGLVIAFIIISILVAIVSVNELAF
ncbi:General secretion pathway protein F [Thioalkalivibrio nitratireducens DSM 14787]|uniref:General secretion pathway protein F n=1 Tax=Thioalkalivibrio nitratireducens (strain DSM 14787 / UNIQEM 213 / ALEN2) TaxID=1255043 RepID=L0DVF3_THIND|nr:type II secretion system F family protein [Thioalkalivibrio nitratireducens]AGA33584.1 General secretion pathway protein F [Thioalkalivibrio nitratireducens DSM 14787]